MKILVITQYFWPENFRVNDLCDNLQKRGYDVTVLTAKPNYPSGRFFKGYNFFNKKEEIWNNIKILRTSIFPRRNGRGVFLLLNYLSFAFFACLKIFFINEKFDKIIVYQLSPATVGFPALLAKKKFKAPIYFYIQDLWPESVSDAGGINSKYGINIINRMMNLFYNNSTQLWVQSKGFIDFLVKKGVDLNKIKYLPNTVEEFYIPQKPSQPYINKFPIGFNILFAGNIGVAQDFNTIINAAKILSDKNLPINWVIIGDGRERKSIEELIFNLGLSHKFYFLGSYPSFEMPFYFACADVLLVSLKKSLIFSLTIPSKLQSYLACRKPIIGNIDGVSSQIILESDCGLCSSSGNINELVKNIEFIYNKNDIERDQFAINAYNYYINNFERNVIYDKLIQYLNI